MGPQEIANYILHERNNIETELKFGNSPESETRHSYPYAYGRARAVLEIVADQVAQLDPAHGLKAVDA